MIPLIALLLALVAFGQAADESKPETTTHRITGLFSPQREAALRAAMEKLPGVTLVSVDFEHAEAVLAYDATVAFKDTKPEQGRRAVQRHAPQRHAPHHRRRPAHRDAEGQVRAH